ncbi:MAG: nicotinate (nicotinamide) nucleotide adenylyltransferase, partial [Achromobacter xylosoxidans]|nr:nicotinate (nicotinamide) nucleotide adenylyltransferase [Achromobacter xylosoxidans]
MKRIGLLGGSFDPVHVAHVALAENALRALDLAQVQLIPAANPWQRAALHATAEQRRAMLELAIAGRDGLAVNPIELERGGATYTIDTLRALPADARYVWLLGADQLANFCTWQSWRDIASLVDLAVATRPGTPLTPPAELADWLRGQGRELEELPFAPMPVSASQIRERLARGEPTDGLLAPPVAAYI